MSKVNNRNDFCKYESLCRHDSKKIVCEENKRKYILENVSGRDVYKYQIDGGIYGKNEDILRADYLILADADRCQNRDAYVIELKGSKIIHGLQQIESTINQFNQALKGYMIHARLIHSSGVHKMFASPEANKLLKKLSRLKTDFKSAANELKETI